MESLYASADRMVIVPATTLDDLLELSGIACGRLTPDDPLRSSLIGAVAATRIAAAIEP